MLRMFPFVKDDFGVTLKVTFTFVSPTLLLRGSYEIEAAVIGSGITPVNLMLEAVAFNTLAEVKA